MERSGDSLIGNTLGGFEIVASLGEGGMGQVYKAYDRDLDRHVALKTLAPALEYDPTCVQRFQREARAIAALRHPNLMHVYAVGVEKGKHFFAMEYIEGISLEERIRGQGPMPVEECVAIAGQILAALHKVHEHGIIHRDLKPGNVLLDEDGRAVLVDFGLSKDTSLKKSVTQAGTLLGTPDYMAPEQIEGEPVGPHTDLYALSVILYEMLSGVLPFHRKNAMQTLRAHCEERPVPLAELRAELDACLVAAVEQGMARRAAERFPSASAMALALEGTAPSREIEELARLGREIASPTDVTRIAPPSSAPAPPVAGDVVIPSRAGQRSRLGDTHAEAEEAAPAGAGASRSGARPKSPSSRRRHALRMIADAEAESARALRRSRLLAYSAVGLSALLVLLAVVLRTGGGGDGPPPLPLAEKEVRIYVPRGREGAPEGVREPLFRVMRADGSVLLGVLVNASPGELVLRQWPGGNAVHLRLEDIRWASPSEFTPGRGTGRPRGGGPLRGPGGRRPGLFRTPRADGS